MQALDPYRHHAEQVAARKAGLRFDEVARPAKRAGKA
jgi:hypothetical protein